MDDLSHTIQGRIMNSKIIAKSDAYSLEKIVSVFTDHSISLHPSGIWEWDEKREKSPIDANRKDGLDLKRYSKDNMLKHRAELSGVAVIDCDGVPFKMVDKWFPTTKKSFYTHTSSLKKQHRYLYPPKGKVFPEGRAIKKKHNGLDVITKGIVFEAHDYLSKDSKFSMHNGEIKRCTLKEYELVCEILDKPKDNTSSVKAKTPKQNKFSENKNPIISKFNEKFSSEELLMAQDYISMRDRMIHPNSESGIAGIIFFEDGCVYSHSSDWLNDGSSHDAFDIYAHYEHDGNKSEAMASARDLLDLDYYGFERSKEIVDYLQLKYIKDQIGYSAKERQFYMLTPEGKLVQTGKADLWEFISRTFPSPFGYHLIEDQAEEKHPDDEKAQKAFIDEMNAKIGSVAIKSIYDIQYSNSYDMMEYSINPFAEESTVTITGSVMRVEVNNLFPNLSMQSIKYDYKTSMAIHRDFVKHFPEFPEFLALIIASRFGGDRKKTFVYTQMVSDFGKSFLGAVFARLGLLVAIKEKELKKAFSGDPVAMDATEFQTAWILFFDEFKSAVSELKDITHHLTLSPKNQMRQKVQLYTKWSASKESSESLTGHGGVDDQFANRFSMIDTGNKKLTDRKLYQKDNKEYFEGLTYAIYSIIKSQSNKYIAMGEKEASLSASKVVDEFRSKYALKATLTDNVQELVDEIIEYIEENVSETRTITDSGDELRDLARYTFVKHKGEIYLKSVNSLGNFFEKYTKKVFGDKHYHKVSYQKHELRNRFADKKHRKIIKINEKKVKMYHLLGYFDLKKG